MERKVFIDELNLYVDLKEENGIYITDEIELDENKMYTFEMVKDGLVSGIRKKRTLSVEPIMTIAELKEKYSVNTFGHFYVCHTGPNKAVVSFRKDCTSIKRYVKRIGGNKNIDPENPIPGYIQLELLDGTIINGYTPEDVEACCVWNNDITVNGVRFQRENVLKVWFGDDFDLTSLECFGFNFTNLIYLNKIPNGITGDYCLESFLSNCTSFNHPIVIPEGVKGRSCLAEFLYNCSSFNQPITIPEGVTGNMCLFQFLNFTSFNHPITIPESVGGDWCLEQFLGYTPFNHPIVLPHTISGDMCLTWFLVECEDFNSPITMPVVLTGNNCLTWFLARCSSFNQPLTIPENLKGEEALEGFLARCTSFNQPLTIPEGIDGSNIFVNFMLGCDSMVSPITINEQDDAMGGSAVGQRTVLSTNNQNSPMYTQGVPIIGTQAAQFRAKFPNLNGEFTDNWNRKIYRNLK